MAEVEAMENFCGDPNQEGITTFEYIPTEHVQFFNECTGSDYTLQEPPVLKPGRSWLAGQGVRRTHEYDEPENITEHGPFFEQGFAATVPYHNPQLAGLFQRMTTQRYILRYVDPNGFTVIVGTLNFPLTFSSSMTTTGVKGHAIRFDSQSEFKAYFLPN